MHALGSERSRRWLVGALVARRRGMDVVPSASERLNQLNRGGELADAQREQGLLVGDQYRLCGNDVEIGPNARLVLGHRDIQESAGCLDGHFLTSDLPRQNAQARDVVFDL